MSISSGLKLDGVYMDFMGFIPTMTHMFNRKKLNRRFTFLLDPSDYCSTYERAPSKNYYWWSLFIHNIGLLRRLTFFEAQRHHFWWNLFDKQSSYRHFEQMRHARLYPYAPYIIKPSFGISLNLGMINTRERIKYSHVATEVRLFPQGTTVAHIKVYIKASLGVEETVDLQNALMKDRIFNLTNSTALRLGLKLGTGHDMQHIFSAIGKSILKTIYIGDLETIDKTTPIMRHRIISPIADFDLTDPDVAAIIVLSKKPRFGEIEDCKKNRVKPVLEPGTIMAFGYGATLLYAPKTDPKVLNCFRNNYSNVVELSLLQDFFLNAIISALNQNTLNSEELFSSEITLAACQSFSHYSQHKFGGGHRRLFKLIMRKTHFESKRRKIEKMSEIYAPASLIIKQMEEPQSTLLAMINNTDAQGNFVGTIDAQMVIKPIWNLGDNIKNNIRSAMVQIEQEELKMYPNIANLQSLKAGILGQMSIYETKYLFQYKNLVEKLLANKEQIKKTADEKRQSNEKVPDENGVQELLKKADEMLNETKRAEPGLKETDSQKPKSFFEKAKPYIGAAVGAASAILKALGYLPA